MYTLWETTCARKRAKSDAEIKCKHAQDWTLHAYSWVAGFDRASTEFTHIHTHTQTYTHTHIRARTHIHTHTHTHAHTRTHTHTQGVNGVHVPMMSKEKFLHTRSEFLGIFPSSPSLKTAVQVFGNSVDHGAKDIFRCWYLFAAQKTN